MSTYEDRKSERSKVRRTVRKGHLSGGEGRAKSKGVVSHLVEGLEFAILRATSSDTVVYLCVRFGPLTCGRSEVLNRAWSRKASTFLI